MNQLEDSHKGMRENIVSAATEVFSRYGFKKTSMEDIARALRMGKSSIYYYFKGKEEIFQAVVDREANLLRVKVKAVSYTHLTLPTIYSV